MFSDEEVEEAVLRYLTDDATAPRTAAGTRDIVAVHRQVMEILSASFLLRPDSIFYLCWLASNRARATAAAQLLDLLRVQELAPRAYQTSRRVESTVELVNAQAALLSLQTAYSDRSAGVGSNAGPAVARVRDSLQSFMRTELAKNIVRQGDIVETPEELRETIHEIRNQVVGRQVELLDLLDGIRDCLTELEATRLPSTVAQNFLGRAQSRLQDLTTKMGASTAARDSRSAFLELSALRSLLQRTASFQTPRLRKAPRTGDASSGTIQGSGTPAGTLGTVSGPFNYAAGTALDLELAGTPVSIELPGTSQATLRSVALPVWAAPPGGAECSIYVDRAGTPTVASTDAWVDGAAAAAALSTALGIDVTWDTSTEQLVLRSPTAGDDSHLLFDVSTDDRAAFVEWLFGAASARSAVAEPVPADVVRDAIAVNSAVTASVETASLGRYTARRYAAGVLELSLYRGTGLISDDSAEVTAGVNFEELGVTPGMCLVLSGSAAAGTYSILSVQGQTLLLDAPVVAATSSFAVGQSFASGYVGARVALQTEEGTAYYRVVSGDAVFLGVDRDVPEQAEAEIFTEYLRVSARSAAASETLEVQASAGATALGLATGTYRAALDTLVATTDFLARGVETGDLLYLTSPSSVATEHQVVAVGARSVRFEPPVSYASGNWAYDIHDREVAHHADLIAELKLYDTRTEDLDALLLKLARGARYSTSLQSELEEAIEALVHLVEALDAYTVQREPTVEQAVRTMQEYGFDRALDLFLRLRLKEFFELSSDGVSYKTWVIRKSAEVAREVVPVTRGAADPARQWQGSSMQRTTFDPTQPEIHKEE